jgi:hypothetical protein
MPRQSTAPPTPGFSHLMVPRKPTKTGIKDDESLKMAKKKTKEAPATKEAATTDAVASLPPLTEAVMPQISSGEIIVQFRLEI